MLNPFLKYVQGIESGFKNAKSYSISGSNEIVESNARVLLFSPHPDDECISGLLPLRLMREAGKKIINVPVTFGSNQQRQSQRAEELSDACEFLGWEIYRGQKNFAPLEKKDIVDCLNNLKPETIFLPHDRDWNTRHISTHQLLMKSLQQMEDDFSCNVVETEFWGAMSDPNLMVQGDTQLVADLVAATSLHKGEVIRNPYHLLLPAWMQDNVRRGSELVCGQGKTAPDFIFATLYRFSKWQNGTLVMGAENGNVIPLGADNLSLLSSVSYESDSSTDPGF